MVDRVTCIVSKYTLHLWLGFLWAELFGGALGDLMHGHTYVALQQCPTLWWLSNAMGYRTSWLLVAIC